MSRVLLLNSSPRRGGNTEQVLEIVADVIREGGVEAQRIDLAGSKVESCIACGKCKKLGNCVLKDGIPELIDRLRESQGFIVGAPVYFGTARGDLMSALQRIGMVSYGNDRFLARMVGGPIAVARRGGHTASLQEMLMFYLINDMIVAGSTYWNMVIGREPGEALNDTEGIETVKRFGENVAFLARRLHD